MTAALWFFSCVACLYVGLVIGGMARNSKPAQPLKRAEDSAYGDYPHIPTRQK